MRPTAPAITRSAPAASGREGRRARLMARTALCGALALTALGARPAAAQVAGLKLAGGAAPTDAGMVTHAQAAGAATPTVTTSANETDIALHAPRTIVDWSQFDIAQGETAKFTFGGRSDIVVNRVTSATASTIDGALKGVWTGGPTPGGNVWVINGAGVIFGQHAQVDVGGLLATTSPLATTDTDFINGTEATHNSFDFGAAAAGTSVSVLSGAQLTAHGGTIALIAPQVATEAGATISAPGGDVLYGAADAYSIQFAPNAANDLDLFQFIVGAETDGTASTTPLNLGAATSTGNAYMAVVNQHAVVGAVVAPGDITATAAAGVNGDIILTAGASLANGGSGIAASAVTGAGATTLTVSGAIGAGRNLVLSAPGALDASAAQLTASTGDLSLSGGAGLKAGAITATAGDTTLTTSAGDVTLSGAVNAAGQAVTITSAGTITQTAGVLTAATLTGSSGGDVSLDQANQIGTLGDFTGGGAFSLTNAVALTVGGTTGLSNTSGDVSLTTTAGDLTLAKSIDAGTHGLTLISAGKISQSGGLLTAAALTGSSGGDVSLDQANQIGTLGDFTGGGAFSLTNAVALTVGGTTGLSNTSGDVSLTTTAGDLTLAKSIDAGTHGLTLTSAGKISQSGGVLTAAALTGSSGGATSLTGGNAISTLDAFTSSGAFSLTNAGHALTLNGALTAGGMVSLSTTGSGDLILAHALDASGQTVQLASAGTITQTVGSTLTAGTLNAHSAADLAVNATVSTLSSYISDNGSARFTSGGALTVTGPVQGHTDVSLATTAGDLTVAGAVSSATGNVSLAAGGGLDIAGSVTTPATLSLSAGGAISQSGGLLTAATLTGSSGGDVSLDQANQIGTLGDFTGGGAFSLTNAVALTVGGTTGLSNTSGDVSLTTTAGDLTLAGSIDAGTHGLTLISAGAISQSGGLLTAAALTGSSGGDVSLGQANQIGTLGDFTGGGAFSLTNAVALTVGGTTGLSNTSGDVSLTTTAGDLTLAGSIDAGTHGLTLTSAGAISQSGGLLTAATLTGSSGGATSLTDGNAISTLDAFTSSGAFSLTNAGHALTLNGALTAGGTVSLSTTGSGDLILAHALDASGQTVQLASAGTITQTVGSTLTAGTLNAHSAADLAVNATVSTLSSYISDNGSARFTSGGALTVTGPVQGHTDVSLATTAGDLTVAGAVSSATGNVSLAAGGGLDIAGSVTTPATLSLSAGGAISQSGGLLTAATLTGSSGGDVSLGQANQIGTLGDFTGGGAFSLTNAVALTVGGTGLSNTSGDVSLTTTAGDLTLAGSIDAGAHGLTLTSAGKISQSGGLLTAAALTGSSGRDVSLDQANKVGTLGDFTGGGAFSLTNAVALTVGGTMGLTNTSGDVSLATTAGDLTLAGSIDAGTHGLTLISAGAISQSGGLLTTAALTGSSGGDVSLDQANKVGTLGDFTGGGAFSLTNVVALTVGGTMGLTNTSGDVSLSTTAGDLTLAGSIDAGTHGLTLISAGKISQSGGVLTAATLTGSSGGATSLTGGNAISTLDAFISGGAFSLTNAGHALTLNGALTAGGTVSLSTTGSGDLILAHALDASGQTVQLASAGTITQTVGSTLTAGTLNAHSAADLAVNATVSTLSSYISDNGSARFTSGGALTVTGPVQGHTDVSLATTAGDLTVAGAVSSATGNVSLAAGGGLDIAGSVTTPATLSLSAGGAISQSGGLLTAATLTGSSGGDVSLGQANHIGSLGDFTGGGAFSLTNAVALTVGGTTGLSNTSGDVSLTTTAGDLTLAKSIDAGTHGLTLTSAGKISQSGGLLTAAALTGSSGGDVNLGQANHIGSLGDFTGGGAFSLTNAVALTVGGTTGLSNTSGDVSLTTTAGDLTLAGSIDAGTHGLTLTSAGKISQSGGLLTAATLTGSSGGATSLTGGNAISTLDAFISGGAFSLTNAGHALTLNGTLTAGGTVSLSTTGSGDLILAHALDASGQTVQLASAGTITQTVSSTLTAALLTGSSGGDVTLGQANQIATLGDFTGNGAFSLTNAGALTVGGTMGLANAGGNVALTTTAGDLTITGSINAGGHILTLASAGAISQSGGVLTAVALTGSSAGVASLTGGNAISALGDFTSGGAFGLTNAGHALTLNGTLTAGGTVSLATTGSGDLILAHALDASGQTVQLVSAGAISQTAGTITAATLTGSSGGDALFTADNAVSTLGAFTSGGGFSLSNRNHALTFNGPLNAGGAVALSTAGSGDLNLNGTLAASMVSLSSAGAINQLSGVLSAGTLNAHSAANLAVNATVSILGSYISDTGSVRFISGGALTVTGPVQGRTDVSLATTTGALTVAGAVSSATGNVSLTAGGGLGIAGSVSTPGTLSLSAGGDIVQTGGTISAVVLTGVAGGGASLTAANAIPTLGAFSTGGAFSLNVANRTLTVNGPLTTGGGVNLATLGSGDLVLAQSVGGAGQAVALNAAGAIRQGAGAVVTAASLSGSAGSGVMLDQTNQIAALGDLTVGSGGVVLRNGRALNLAGRLAAEGQAVDLVTAGALTQDAGAAIAAASLTGAASGGTSLLGANQIGTLGDFTNGGSGGFALNNGQGLSLAGVLDASGQAVTLNIAGVLSEAPGGVIRAASLAGSSAGGATLDSAGNTFAAVDGFANTSGGALTLRTSGVLAAANVSNPGGEVSVTAGGSLTLTGQVQADDLSLTAGGALLAGGAQVSATTLSAVSNGGAEFGDGSAIGAVSGLHNAGSGAVVIRSSRSLRVSDVTNAGGAITVQTGGDLDVGADGAGVSAQTDLTLSAAGAASIASARAGRDLTIEAGSLTLSAAATAGRTASIRAGALALDGSLNAGQEIDIASTRGGLMLGGAAADGAGGLGLSAAEFARLGAPSVMLYAGDPQGGARGDLTVGDLQVDPAKVGRLTLLAGADNTVTVSGALTPAAAGLGGGQPVLTIGAASQASGWTPKAILVTGSIGSGVVNSPLDATNGSVKAFQSVELNAAQDIVLGTPGFVSAVRGAPAASINVTRSLPATILAAPAPAGKLFLATGTLTLRSGGKLVQQNTAILPGEFSGVLVTNPARAAVPIVLGRPGSGAPGVMDLFATFVDAQGAVISDKIAAASSAIRLDSLSGNANYRVNSCVIAQPGTCTPITTMIINVQPTRFTDAVAIRTQDEDADTDPTITGAGNEEIWRTQE